MPYTIERPSTRSMWIRSYLPEVIRGLAVTAKHFLKNLIRIDRRMTVEYPDQRRQLPPGYRAEHRLLAREDGSIRCTACMLCQTVCPAHCISIEAEEVDDPVEDVDSRKAALRGRLQGLCSWRGRREPLKIEKRPRSFVIDELRCVFCGLCVEACPCDAIRMDTAKYENARFNREDFIYDMEKLLNNEAKGQSKLSGAL